MPQGGIDEGEEPYKAALRELYEETSIKSVEKLGEVADWIPYDIPRNIVGAAWKGKYRGQKQKWYALRFTGDESEIDILNPGGGHEPEFIAWRWEKIERLPELVVPFKRPAYEQIVREFARFTR
jgi:putative (di)nucleoside polyphosphate hydrolase